MDGNQYSTSVIGAHTSTVILQDLFALLIVVIDKPRLSPSMCPRIRIRAHYEFNLLTSDILIALIIAHSSFLI